MALRRLPSSEGGYLVGCHPLLGCLLIDPAHHQRDSGRQRQAFSVDCLGDVWITAQELASAGQDTLSEGDLDLTVYYYESFRRRAGWAAP